MSYSLRHAVATCCLILTAGSGIPSVAAAEIAACEISAWSTDDDPNGLAVRAGPGTGNAVIGRLLPPADDESYGDPEVAITGSKNGWFRISDAIMMDYDGNKPDKVLFKGEGWVSGRYLGLLLNDSNLYREPSLESPVVAKLSFTNPNGNLFGPDSYTTRLHACKGDWVEVDASYKDTHFHGWATRTCSNQVTTCP